MAIIASKVPLLPLAAAPGTGVGLRPRPPRRSPEGADEAWTCEAEYKLYLTCQFRKVAAGYGQGGGKEETVERQ